jgi:DNA-binding NarL/FixJ family response regulator
MTTTVYPVSVGIVSEQPTVRGQLREAISTDRDFELAWEADGSDEAIYRLHIKRPDVLIAHAVMSAPGGLHFAHNVAEAAPSTKMVVIEAEGEPGDVGRALAAGVAGYLVGSLPDDDVLDRLRAISAGGLFLDAAAGDGFRETIRQLAMADSPLSVRELEVLSIAAEGLPNKEIAARLDISVRTVETHLSNVLHKLDLSSRTAAVTYAMSRDWLCAPVW